MSLDYYVLGDTVYFWFAANDTSGSGADGATPVYDVRLAGAAADAIPVLSGAATLLTHANYPDGCHEVAVAATAGNGFAAGNTYAVFCTLLVDSQNPTGYVGSFKLDRQHVDVREILGTTLTESVGGYLAAAFKKFLNVAAPIFTAASPNVPSATINDYKATVTNLTTLLDLFEGDVTVDTGVTPWALVIYRKDTVVELFRKKLYEVDDTAVTAVTQRVAQHLESAP